MGPELALIATDLDGTLLRSDGTLSRRTSEVLRLAVEHGVHVAIATARPWRAFRPLFEDAPLAAWAVCQNGAVVYEMPSFERAHVWEMEGGLARRIVEELRLEVDGVSFAIEMDDLFHCEPHFGSRLQAMEPPEVTYGDALELIVRPLTKLLAYHPSYASAELASRAMHVIGERGVVTHSGAGFVEISAAGVTKAFGLAALCDRLGVESADVVAFGDMPNDLAMMQWAGRCVAVANAHPDVIECADEVTGSNDDDGVAEAIVRMLA